MKNILPILVLLSSAVWSQPEIVWKKISEKECRVVDSAQTTKKARVAVEDCLNKKVWPCKTDKPIMVKYCDVIYEGVRDGKVVDSKIITSTEAMKADYNGEGIEP